MLRTLLLFADLSLHVRGTVRGVSPEDSPRYTGEAFHCLQSGAPLPFSAVNDDFCDCEDGSDEPGTAACAGKPTLFYCVNDLSFPEYVYSSRVTDGVCDCCDGSDELTGCANSCREEGVTLRAARDRRKADRAAGVKQRQQVLRSAEATRGKHLQELETLRGQEPKLEMSEQEAQAAVNRAMAALDAEREERQRESERQRENSSTVETSVAAEEAEAEAMEEQSGGADSATSFDDEDADIPEDVSEYARWMEGADKGTGGDKKTPHEDEAPTEKLQLSLWGQWILEKVNRLWVKLFGKSRTPAEKVFDAATAAESEAKRKLRVLRDRARELEGKLNGTFRADRLAYSALDGQCLKKVTEFKYELCFFDKATQDTTSLGKWRWEGPHTGVFENGQRCPGAGARHLRVQFLCGASADIKEVGEPSRCTYEAVVWHPAACDGVDVDEATVRRPDALEL